MSKNNRIENYNNWPARKKFSAEIKFIERLKILGDQPCFTTYKLHDNENKDFHVTVSYLIDAIDSLPLRPDHAFDWVWRAFEYLLYAIEPTKSNITERLRTKAIPIITTTLESHNELSLAFIEFINEIPFQTCEYLTKQIITNSPYDINKIPVKDLTPYAKRLVLKSGNPPGYSNKITSLLIKISENFNYTETTERRKSASLLKKSIQAENIKLTDSINIKLGHDEVIFLLVSGLLYEFRNDRAHAQLITPFASSTAQIKTYAHCWYLFLFVYNLVIILLYSAKSPVKLDVCPSSNIKYNTAIFKELFGSHLTK